MSASKAPGRYPAGRCGTDEFCRITGLGKTTFHMKYRPDPHYIELFDIRVDGLNRLNMSLQAAKRFAVVRAGTRPHGNTGRFSTYPCPACDAHVAGAARRCKHCGQGFCCAECHEPVRAATSACPRCGRVLREHSAGGRQGET